MFIMKYVHNCFEFVGFSTLSKYWWCWFWCRLWYKTLCDTICIFEKMFQKVISWHISEFFQPLTACAWLRLDAAIYSGLVWFSFAGFMSVSWQALLRMNYFAMIFTKLKSHFSPFCNDNFDKFCCQHFVILLKSINLLLWLYWGKFGCTSGTYYQPKVNSTTHFITGFYDSTQSIGYFIIIKYGGVM